MSACIRNLFYMAQDVRNLLWPSQLTRTVMGRDYEHAVKKATPPYDIEELFGAVHEQWEQRPDPMEMFDRIRAEACGLTECVEPTTIPAVPDPAAPPPQTPRGDDDPVGVTAPSAPAGSTKLVEVIAGVLADHRPSGGTFVEGTAGQIHCIRFTQRHALYPDWQSWREHVAELIAERIEKATRTAPVESGVDIGMSYAAEMFPQHRK